jgi:CRISPR-associated endonuclease Cas2
MKRRKALSFVEKVKRISRAGIPDTLPPQGSISTKNLNTVEERVAAIFHIIKANKHPANYMLFFVMYDIESTKVRNQIVKYLLKKGCSRIQKSIFLADLPINTYEEIKSDLTEVQQCYENNDSILIVPISTDYLQCMKIIGQTIDIDLILKNKNTLFF